MTANAPVTETLICPHCGGQYREPVAHCPWCGKQVAVHCLQCGQLVDGAAAACPHCGAPVAAAAGMPQVDAAQALDSAGAGRIKFHPKTSAPARDAPPAPTPAPRLPEPAAPPPVILVSASVPEARSEIVPTWQELRGGWRIFAVSEWIMRDRAGFFEEIRSRRDLGRKLRSMVASTIVYMALYGLVMGVSHSPQQALMSAIKLPVLFLVTLLISLPTLYFFNLLYGSQLTLTQTAALMMAAVTVTGALALAFGAITLFFWMSVPDYSFFVLLNVGVLGITAWWGLSFLRQGMRHVQRGAVQGRMGRILFIWILIYAFVGTQMGWALKPFFGAPGAPFEVIRYTQGTFYTSVVRLIVTMLGF